MDSVKTFFQTSLDTDITYLKGVGPQRGSALKKYGIENIGSLLHHFPRKYLDRTTIKSIRDTKIGEETVIIGKIESFGMKKTRKRRYFQVLIYDPTGYLTCVWFNSISWIVDKFKIGDTIGTTTKIISIKSKKNPRKNIKTITNNMAAIEPPGKFNKNSSTTSSPPKPRKTRENIEAPTSIIKTIELIFVVSRDTILNLSKLNCFEIIAINVAPTAPTAADSVGVAIPVNIEPKTTTIKISGAEIIFNNEIILISLLVSLF